MTKAEATNMLKAKLECLKRETSGTDFDCNNSNCDDCPLCYEQGHMWEQKEALQMAIKVLEQQPCEDTISRQAVRFIESDSDAYPQEWNDDYEKGFTDALNKVLALPSAEARTQMSSADCISRQAAIDALMGEPTDAHYPSWYAERLEQLPSAQPEPIKINIDDFNKEDLERFKKELGNTPITVLPAQPDERMLHESCTDCPLYDKDRHSCPRFNKVIPVTLRELQSAQPEQQWIPCSERLPSEHKWLGTKKFGTTISNEVYVTFEAPDGQRFAKHISFQNGKLSPVDEQRMKVCFNGAKPIAWMPLPEPYREEREQR